MTDIGRVDDRQVTGRLPSDRLWEPDRQKLPFSDWATRTTANAPVADIAES